MGNITTDFIAATKKIHADVRAALIALHLIREDVKTLRDKSVSESDKQPPQEQTGDSNTVHSSGPALKTNKSGRDKKEGNDDSASGFQRFKKRWNKSLRKPVIQLEIAALIGLGIYTCETHRTNNLTEKSMKFQFSLARSQARSYLQVDAAPFDQLKLEDMQTLSVELGLKNFGKVTASNVKAQAVFELRLAAQQPSFDYTPLHVAGILPPMAPEGTNKLQPGITDNGLGPAPMDETTRGDLKHGRKYIVVFGRIEYEDAFGGWWQNFCVWKAFTKEGSFNASSCILFNTEGGTPKTFPAE